MVVYRIALFALVSLSSGCMSTGNPVNRTTSNFLALQLKNSRTIPDPSARASAMVAVARSAAYSDDIDHYNRAMRELRGDPRHDETAMQCATFLAEAGKPESAKRVAKKIDDPARKRDVLEQIAGKSNTPAPGPPDTTGK
jgi:hypothetical protein